MLSIELGATHLTISPKSGSSCIIPTIRYYSIFFHYRQILFGFITTFLILNLCILTILVNNQTFKFLDISVYWVFCSPCLFFYYVVVRLASVLRMAEWLRSKQSERFHFIMKEPKMTVCGQQFLDK